MPNEIAAAGAVLWRIADGRPEVAVVHRPRYDDWSLPKGKRRRGESGLATAAREITEETGAIAAVDRRLGQIRYRIEGAVKVVDYWSMRHLRGQFVPGDEIDRLEWLDPAAATRRLSYDLDRTVLGRWTALPPTDSVVLLVRHAKAGKRESWPDDDRLRPLEPAGAAQAQRLVGLIGRFATTHVVSANLVRCTQTVLPYAQSIGAEVEIDPVFTDDRYAGDPQRTYDALCAQAVPGRVTVIASQGGAIPALIDDLALVPRPRSLTTRKAAVWAISFIDGNAVAADYYEDALRRNA
jgi:8-oxo-dGTP pyrophosphatase MutT (NUDIX family)